jgi:aminoglycoside phosphotransferase family enzyme
MDSSQKEFFLESYRRASGDDAKPQTKDFEIAYAAFRAGYCLMAANAMKGNHEQQRLEGKAREYLDCLSAHAAEPQDAQVLFEARPA